MSAKSPTLFLDRDGTINVDLMSQYLSDPAATRLIPGAGKAIVTAKRAGFKIAVITNQAGVAKGLTKKEAIPEITKRLEVLIATEAGASSFEFDDVQVCMHHPDENCRCRKPQTELLERSISVLNSALEKSYFIGDKCSDLICAARAGMASILVLTGHGLEARAELQLGNSEAKPVAIVESLEQAIEFIVNQQTRLR